MGFRLGYLHSTSVLCEGHSQDRAHFDRKWLGYGDPYGKHYNFHRVLVFINVIAFDRDPFHRSVSWSCTFLQWLFVKWWQVGHALQLPSDVEIRHGISIAKFRLTLAISYRSKSYEGNTQFELDWTLYTKSSKNWFVHKIVKLDL